MNPTHNFGYFQICNASVNRRSSKNEVLNDYQSAYNEKIVTSLLTRRDRISIIKSTYIIFKSLNKLKVMNMLSKGINFEENAENSFPFFSHTGIMANSIS